jgi:hypothetical protein
MVLMQRLRVSSLDGKASRVPVTLSHRRALPDQLTSLVDVDRAGSRIVVKNRSFGQTLLEVDGADGDTVWSGVRDNGNQSMKRMNLTVALDVPAAGFRELVVKLPSPMLDEAAAPALAKLDYETARAETLKFWGGWVEKGAKFEVPEKVVNDLFRARLWHTPRLLRRHGAAGDVRIDLPYSNFAYSQNGTPWPVNQAVYVDYMLFGLRGYGDVAAEELRAQYRNNQELDGHVSGYANWVVIRTFYSYMASAFSHSTLKPVEHRFTHGQYFGPPSTDGAWFELYRDMLIHERDDDSLLLAGFTPRRWLDDGKQIEVRGAPTRFGPLSMKLANTTAGKQLEATVEMPGRTRPQALLVRFRHAQGSRIRGVTVNGRQWTDFDAAKEWVRIPAPTERSYSIVAHY